MNAIALALSVIPATAVADMRGEVVCGIPPDEAVAYVYQNRRGSWLYVGLHGRQLGGGHRSADEALAANAPEEAEYVCEVEVTLGTLPGSTGPARLYRLRDSFIARGAVNEQGEPLDWDYDPRQNIVGVPAGMPAPKAAETDLGRLGLCGIPLSEATVALFQGIYWIGFGPDGILDDAALDAWKNRANDADCEFEVVWGAENKGTVFVFRLGRPLAEDARRWPLRGAETEAQCSIVWDRGLYRAINDLPWEGPQMGQVCRLPE